MGNKNTSAAAKYKHLNMTNYFVHEHEFSPSVQISLHELLFDGLPA